MANAHDLVLEKLVEPALKDRKFQVHSLPYMLLIYREVNKGLIYFNVCFANSEKRVPSKIPGREYLEHSCSLENLKELETYINPGPHPDFIGNFGL